MRPVRRELRCQHCHHNECHVTMKISKPPRILILQLNRYAFLGGEPKKIQTTMGTRKYLSLNTYVTDDAVSPPGWIPTETQPCTASDFGELDPSGLSSAVSPPPPPPPESQTPQPAHPQCPLSVAVAKDAVAAPPALAMTPTTAQPLPDTDAESTRFNTDPDSKPNSTSSGSESRKIQEVCKRPPGESVFEQTHSSKPDIEDGPPLGSVIVSNNNTYHLMSMVSHHGNTTQMGHYVSDVYNADRGRWFRYDDRRVSCRDEADVLGDSERNGHGYIFFYMHEDLCSLQSVSQGSPLSAPLPAEPVERP